jgi:two-component system CheB/CheR fusion protein
MTQLLKYLPRAPGPAFVVVQHSAPITASALTALLSRATSMPVSEARNNVRLKPNQVYVMPPGSVIKLAERRLRVSRCPAARDFLSPIDRFLESLAAQAGDRVIGVILSGNGLDGTRGLMAVRAAGGITFAQPEKSAKFPAMPASAIAAGSVDCVLPPEQIAGELARIALQRSNSPRAADGEVPSEPSAEEQAFYQILEILLQRTGVDFTHYRHGMLQHRVRRRMSLAKVDSLASYARHLQFHASEIEELFNDILLHVTGFFRDAGLFKALRKNLFPALFRNKDAQEPIRIWVPGCSTGQEVYSIAIALVEFMHDHKLGHPVQIFGTDIHHSALEIARAGVYAGTIEADISVGRLVRFFQKADGGYLVSNVIRKMCIFGRHNVVVDPPYSNLDLISCRNVLSYLDTSLQRKVIPLFHYALKSDGFLVLGASETVGGFSDLFALRDREVRSYSKESKHLRPTDAFSRGSRRSGLAPGQPQPTLSPSIRPGPSLDDLQKHADRILLSNYRPADVIINQRMEVLRFRGPTNPFLERTGATRFDLLKIAHAGLMPHLRAAVIKAFKQNVSVRRPGLRLSHRGCSFMATVEIVPFCVPPFHEKYCLVMFQRDSWVAGASQAKGRQHGVPRSGSQVKLALLNQELAATREWIRSMVQEQEARLKEMGSANEEILSNNEELHCINEELETARAEMQSTNEELITLNDLLEHRSSELERVNNDLQAVLRNIHVPILVLDANLRLRRLSCVAESRFGLSPWHIGHPLVDLFPPDSAPDLAKVVRESIQNRTDREWKAKLGDGHWWSARISPCTSFGDEIQGVVIRFEPNEAPQP